jgi:NADH-quinone oxidoreductase subunit J
MAGTIAGGSLMLVMVAALKDTDIKTKTLAGEEGNIGLVQELGKVLFTDYVLPFEISSVLFLSAMVGAVVIGKKN